MQAKPEELEEILKPLGLQRKRTWMLLRFSHEYIGALAEAGGSPLLTMERVCTLHGMGKYSCDAHAIFCRGEIASVQPSDIYLGWYLEHVRRSAGPTAAN